MNRRKGLSAAGAGPVYYTAVVVLLPAFHLYAVYVLVYIL